MTELIFSASMMSGLAFFFATLLVVANRFLLVIEDPRLDQVEGMLPGTNCGACGEPGCRALAEKLVTRQAAPGKCTVSNAEEIEKIAAYLGVTAGFAEKRVARLHCAGGANVSRNHALYKGLDSCAAATLVAGGGKGCFWGCLGLGDCELACTFDAIKMNPQGLPVVDEDLCTACGDCVIACPKDLFSLQLASNRLLVACSSLENGDEILEDCQVACTACARCAMDAPDLIEMRNNLPIIDYTKGSATAVATQRCPTGAIVWLDDKAGVLKGQAADKIIRKGALQDAPT